MKIAIIADDLTGANDTGVQFARTGLKTSVLMEAGCATVSQPDVLVIDTDTRAVPAAQAYEKVRQASLFFQSQPYPFDLIYKKIDSTMRGNIGAECDAIYDVFAPDFILIAPAYPMNNRIVRDGHLYLNQKRLNETEMAADPLTPVQESYIPNILRKSTKRRISILRQDDLAKGKDHIIHKMHEFLSDQIPYVVFDASAEADLRQMVTCVEEAGLNVVWAGSAGLAEVLAKARYKGEAAAAVHLPGSDKPVLMVVGSVNTVTRKQLARVLTEPFVKGVELDVRAVLSGGQAAEAEKQAVLSEVARAIRQNCDVVLYSSGDFAAVQQPGEMGTASAIISEMLGELTKLIVSRHGLQRLLLTGGDTARKVCMSMGIAEFRLIDEIEVGVPIGKLVHANELLAITKAGGFGSPNVLAHSLRILKGGMNKCVQSLE